MKRTLLLVFVTLLVLPSSAFAASWSDPVDISDTAKYSFYPTVSSGPSGLITVWYEKNADGSTSCLIASKPDGPSSWGATETLFVGSGSTKCYIGKSYGTSAFGPGGKAAVAYYQYSPFVAYTSERASASGSFSSQKILGSSAGVPILGYGPDGLLTAFWNKYNSADNTQRTGTSTLLSGSWTTPQILSPDISTAYEPGFTVDSTGRATGIWNQAISDVKVVTRDPSSPGFPDFPAAETLESASGSTSVSRTKIFTLPDDSTMAVWFRVDNIMDDFQWRYSTRASGASTWSAPQTLLSVDSEYSYATFTAGPEGTQTFSWVRNDGTHDRMEVLVKEKGASSFSAPVQVSQADKDASSAKLAIGPDGSLIASWTDWGTDGNGPGTIWVSRRAPGATSFSAPETLGSVGMDGDTNSLVVGEDGYATLAWLYAEPSPNDVGIARTASLPYSMQKPAARWSWNKKTRLVTATFTSPSVDGLSWAVKAAKNRGARAGSCRTSSGKTTCRITLPTGKWRVSILPRQYGNQGPAANKLFG